MLAALFSLLLALPAPVRAEEPAVLSVSKIKDMSLRIYGFIETDFFADSRQAYTESEANNLIPKRSNTAGAENYPGRHGRTHMSVRQSRLGFDFRLPEVSGWKPESFIEMDFIGNNAPNTQPGTAPGAQNERDFFNNPAVRVRMAALFLTKEHWNFKVGQWWSLMGWPPEYFTPEPIVLAKVAELGTFSTQFRTTYTYPFTEDLTLETAADAARPASMDSGLPVFHSGLRLSYAKLKSNATVGFGSWMKKLSIAASGELIPLRSQGRGNPLGQAAALDMYVPIIPSPDGKSKANNLSFVGELSAGSGYGALELPALTAGVPAVTAAAAGNAIDSGLAGLNLDGNVEPIRFRTMRGALNYTLPWPKFAVGTGYAQVEGRNLDRFATTAAVAAGIAPKISYAFVSAFYDPLDWLRAAIDLVQTKDTYNDPGNTHAVNNRFQATLYFVF
jgi:hypothetical protein